jgi:hypothetical protein
VEAEGSSPHSQQPITHPYPEPDQSNPHTPSYFLKIHITITVKPRFNVPAFSEIPDLVMIFSCPDNSAI